MFGSVGRFVGHFLALRLVEGRFVAGRFVLATPQAMLK
jgi:hypothetical protein